MVKEKKYGVLVVGDNWGEELTNTNAILCEQKKGGFLLGDYEMKKQ